MKKLFFTLLCLLGTLSSARAEEEFQFIVSTIDSESAMVTSYTGTPVGEITVPASVVIENKTYNITKINGSAFLYCDEITKINLPDGVTVMGGSAFGYCSSLSSINIPSSLEALAGSLFEYCSSLESIELPATLQRINENTFKMCTNLKTVTALRTTPPEIKYNSFDGCPSDMEVYVLPSSLSAYQSAPVWEDMSIKALNVVSSNLNNSSNGNISTDKTAYIPGSTATFDITPDEGFKIGKVTINGVDYTNKVTNGHLTYKVTGDVDIKVTFEPVDFIFTILSENTVSIAQNPEITITGEVVIPPTTVINGKTYTVTTLADGAFRNCSGITRVDIPSTVTTIKGSSFRNCSNLESVAGCGNVTSIGGNGFDGCTSLKRIHWTNFKLEALAGYLFNGCTSLEVVLLPSCLDRINEYAFAGCTSLKTIQLTSKLTKIGQHAFSGCNLEKIICLSLVPPTVVSSSAFSDETYASAVLNTPYESRSAYATADVWKLFVKNTPTAISNIVPNNSNTSSKSINLSGQEVNSNYRGIIIRNGRKFIKK